jgi:hypothetical protein
MRLRLPALLFLLVSLPASAEDTSAKRIEQMVSAGKTWLLHSARLRLALLEQLDPADCKSGSQALAQFLAGAEEDEKLAAKLQTVTKAAPKEENVIAHKRMQKEIASDMDAIAKRGAAVQAAMKQFKTACPTEAKAIHEALKSHEKKLEKMDE